MKKVLILLLVFATVIFADPAGSDGDLPFLPVLDGKITATKTAATNGFAVGTKASAEIIRDLWVGSDFDQDGNKEVLLSSYGLDPTGRAYVYEITGDNTAELFFDTGEMGGGYSSSTRHVAYGDLDGNGMQELLVSVNAVGATGGLYVYEYDTVGDSMRTPVLILSELAIADRWYVEGFFVEDVDGDGVQEIMFGNNGSTNDYDNFYIASVDSGDFASGKVRTKIEFTHGKSSATYTLGGSPYGAVTSDIDGDGAKEVLFAGWDNGAMLIVETDAADTYTVHNYIETDLLVQDGVAFYDFATADLDEDGRDEVYVSMYDSTPSIAGALYCITCPSGTELSAMTTSNVHSLGGSGTSGGVCTQIGDWDLDGKMEIIASGGGSTLTSHEYQGGDPTLTTSWVKDSLITNASFSGVYGMRLAGDLDGDGLPEIYGANTGAVTDAVVAVETTPPPVSTVFISELADPNNNSGLRFVELYNPTDSDIDFSEGSGWKLNKYTNDAATVSQILNLTGTIESHTCFIIATGALDADFEAAYGIAPDQWDGAADNVAGSNGDDNIELVDGTGAVVDLFGVPGEDGTGTNHEFEDGRAVRKATVTTGNPTWDVTEWSIDSDAPSGIGPVDAPDGFDPGVWPTIIPLEIASATSVSLTEIEVKYTVDVSAVNVADYSVLGTSGITFTAADIDAADGTIVKLTASANIVGDVVLDTLVDAANTDSVVFYAGITPIALTNMTNAGGMIDDVHPAVFKGIISANDAYNNVWISDADGAYNGAMIFDYNFDAAVSVGDEVLMTAFRDTYNNQTELTSPALLTTISTANTPYGPSDITGADIDTSIAADADPAEKWEGQLVKISTATVLSYANYQYLCTDDDSVSYFLVGDNVDYQLSNVVMTIGETYDIVGVVDYTSGKYRINPRGADDITVFVPPSNDLNLTFEDDTDVANWGVYDGTSGYTTVAHNATGGVGGTGALDFGDAGYGFYIKRPVGGTVGTQFQLTIDVKTVGWDNKDTYPITIAVEGLGAAAIDDTINALADFTTIVLTGTITNADGYIVIAGGNTSLANAGGTIMVTIDNLFFEDDYQPPVNLDLNLTFEDDTDVANWGVYDGSSGYTTVAHNATGGVDGTGALDFGDAGYAFYIKRPVSGTVGTQYSFTVDVKTVGWDNAATYPITIAIEGLGDTPVSANINALATFTSIPLTGMVTNADGYIVIAGGNTSLANAGGTIMVTIDNLVFNDAADIPDTDPPTIVMAEALNDTTIVVEFSEEIDITIGETLTNYVIDHTIGNPTAATVVDNMVTLKVANLASDTLYTMVVNNVEDLSENVIVTDSEVTFMWQEYVAGPDLFISEYIESPTGNNKALEIYNGKGVAVNLAEYSIRGTHNGDADWAYAVFNFPDIVLEAGDVYILTNTDADPDFAALADTALLYADNTTASFNGDDARALFWGEYMLDIIGQTDGDPGTSWPVAGGVGATADFTLVRKSTVTMGNIDWSASAGTDETTSEWLVFPPATYKFLGSHPHIDFAGPEIIGVVTIGDSLIQVKYSEQVDSTAAVNVANYSIDGGIGSPVSAGIICMHVVTLKLGAGQLLAPNTDYMITVSNIPDLIGNVIEPNTSVLVKNIVPGDLPIDIVSSDFETTAGGWWAPAGSGSTLRILTTSSFELSSDDAYDGTKSKKLTILEDSAKDGGWFIREYNPDKPDVAVDSKLFMYVKSSDPNIQIRFSFYDDGTGGDGDLLASPWIDVTAHADDWQVVGVDLATTPLVKWAGGGDGALSSTNTVSLGSIQLQCPNDVDAVLYFDKLTERPNIAPVEVTFDVSMAVQSILGNFTIGSDFVDVAGSFNNWGGNAMVLDDSDGDSVYTFTVLDLYPGESLEYKFRINGSWDTSEFPSGGPNRTFVVPDTNCVVYHWYNDEDRSVIVGITDMNALPKVFALHQNYPNPFNPITTIKYDLPKEAHVKIMIFDVMGREVRTLVNNRQQAGYQAIQWNAQDNSGRNVSSGYYMYVMQADKFHKTQKMILLK